MGMNETNRKKWNQQQTKFRRLLLSFTQHDEAISMFFNQHAALHTAAVSPGTSWSYEDEIFSGISEGQARLIPPGGDHSIVWLVWHLARIEDITMNILITGEAQILYSGGWFEQLKSSARDAGNGMDAVEIAALSAEIDIAALRAYRQTVGHRTRQIVQGLGPDHLKQKVDPDRLQRVVDEGAVLPAGQGVIDYWSKRDIAGLLLMPPTRHNYVHLNESARIKEKIN
jgi:hypothetical protein